MAVRTKRLVAGESGAANAVVTIYTAPAGETVIVKHIAAQVRVGGFPNSEIGAASGGSGLQVPFFAPMGALWEKVTWAGWLVLQPGDSLWAFSATAAAFRFWVSGTELEGVAD